MKNLLVILAHPDFKHSIANKTIIGEVLLNYPQAEFRNLQELYPDFKIDKDAEQKALLKADIILLQYPFYWYNMPAILKQWFDVVFEYNFAYGSKCDKLKDKYLLVSFTVGGNRDSYSTEGYNHFKVDDFLKNIEQTAYLCQMVYVSPIYGYGNIYIPNIYNSKEIVEERAVLQGGAVIDAIHELMNI